MNTTNKKTFTESMAKEAGFDHANYVDISQLVGLQELRDICATNTCGKYNTNWACPPGCESIEDITKRINTYDYCMFMQCVEKMEDDFDWDAIQRASKRSKENTLALAAKLRDMGLKILSLASGGCQICEKCTYPDAPCRFPEKWGPSLSACGFFVSRECEKAGLTYNHGPQTTTMIAAIFVKE